MSDSGSGNPLLTIDHATKIYDTGSGPLTAIEDLSLSIERGEFVCVLGPSGSGKSTLLWALSGLHPLTSGTIMLNGVPVTSPPREMGMVFQDANLLPWRNLWENMLFPFEIRKQRSEPHHDRIRELLRLSGLAGFEKKMPLELSGGMRQRASIVRCLGFDPGVILMDEPFGALDAFTRDEMNLLIQSIWLGSGKTVIFVTHNITEAVFLADRVVVLSSRPGRIAHIFDIDLPRPRTIDQTLEPPFIEKVQQIKATIERGQPAQRGAVA
ncbi:MAG TPA: ABC transporter ATP-binding protein [Thermomicrobiales bacterium]|jgi:NitT/TauT family transport system ATP-binding protein|nr:ABC transporter ATP-binding protein [Thermomicrobiales bacterium]